MLRSLLVGPAREQLATKALRRAARTMASSTSDPLKVFVVGGTGLIGSALVDMMRKSPHPGVECAGYCNSRYGVKLSSGGEEETTHWKKEGGDGAKFDDDYIAACCASSSSSSSSAKICVADCSASELVSDSYAPWLSKGWHVATPNKKVNSGPLERYQSCIDASSSPDGGQWYVEATIGAGLPVVSTLRTLRATGDRVYKIRGVFSGTMSFLFNTWDGSEPFSSVVSKAKDAGYTEPDPRDDLNGMDVARKVVIAARESGLMISLEDVDVQSLVPAELESVSSDEFMSEFGPSVDGAMSDRASAASSGGNVLRFVGEVDLKTKKASVKLDEFSRSHAFAGLAGADNIIEIETARYGPEGSSTPLIIRGPGAGAGVTAAGVYGDIITLSKSV